MVQAMEGAMDGTSDGSRSSQRRYGSGSCRRSDQNAVEASIDESQLSMTILPEVKLPEVKHKHKLGDSTYSCIPLLQQNVKFFLLQLHFFCVSK